MWPDAMMFLDMNTSAWSASSRSAVSCIDLATSRYGAKDLILQSGRIPIRITVGQPRWPLGYALAYTVRELAPTRPMLGLSTDIFEQTYRARLNDLGVEAIRALLQRCCDDSGNDRLVVLCFENVDEPGKSCHRRMLATLWQEQTGQGVPELQPDVRQEQLFR